MNTTILIPQNQNKIIDPAYWNNIYGMAGLLLLNIAILFWSGGWGAHKPLYDSEAGRMLSTPIQKSSNPFENLLVRSENQGQTITFNPLAPATYGDPAITLTATADSGLPVTFESTDPNVATVSGNLLTIVGAGTVNIIASQSGDVNYNPAEEVVRVLTVNKASLAALADNKSKTYGDPNPVFTITYTGFKGTDNASVIDTPPTLATEVTQFSPVDSYAISFMTGGTDNNYTITPLTDGLLTIVKATLTATADNKTKIYGDPNPPLTITYTGLKGSDNASVIDTPPTLATEVTQFTPADEYSISFISEGTDNNYTITPLNDGTLTITKAPLSATADDKTKSYGDPNPVFTITYSGFKGSDNGSVFDTPPLLSSDATLLSPVASYSISFISEGTDNDYEITSLMDGTLTINKADQAINFANIIGKTIFDDPFTIIATSTSGLPVSFTSSNPAILSISGTTATIHSSGTTIVTASQAGDTNFNVADDVTQEVFINSKMYQTISFQEIPEKAYGSAFNLNATASSNLPVSYTSSNVLVATVAGSTVTLIGLGTTTISANQPGNATYEAAPEVARELVVVKGSQSINFDPLEAKVLGELPFELTATASSDLPVSYLSSNPEIATINGNLITLHAAGTVTITALQTGNDFYNAAENVDQELIVLKKDQMLSIEPVPNKTLGDPGFTISATSTSGLAVTFDAVTTNITIDGDKVTLINAGRATIRATQPGDEEYNAAETVSQSFCINPPKPTVTVTNNNGPEPTLTSSASTGNQWYLNGVLIPAATNSVLTAVQPGVYTVKVTEETCESAASEPVAIIITGDVQKKSIDLVLRPNAVEDRLEVDFTGFGSGSIAVAFVDPLGRIIESYIVQPNTRTFDLNHFAPGIYWIVATQSKYKITKQLVKK